MSVLHSTLGTHIVNSNGEEKIQLYNVVGAPLGLKPIINLPSTIGCSIILPPEDIVQLEIQTLNDKLD